MKKQKLKDLKISVEYIEDKILAQLEGVHKGAKILDIATGKGYLLKLLEKEGYTNLHSADINKEDFYFDKKEYNFKKVDADGKLPYENESFDVVISSETIEHLENPKDFLRKLYRILKPGGFLILTTPNVETIFSRIYFLVKGGLAAHTEGDYTINGHISVLPSWLLLRFTKKIGFKMITETYNCGYIPVFRWKFKNFLLNRLFGWIYIYKFEKPNE